MNREVKRLYKSRTDRMIDGVCGGVAQYLNLDPTLVRIAWVLLTLLGGSGILLYIVAMVVMQKEPIAFMMGSQTTAGSVGESGTAPSKKNSLFWGILLIVVGTFLFLENVGFSLWRHWWWLDDEMFLSLILILVGVAFLWGGRNSLQKSGIVQQTSDEQSGEGTKDETPPVTSTRRLYRSFTDNKLFGVCGGLGEYFGVDSTLIRILFIAGTFASGGIVVIGYIIMAIAVPRAMPTISQV